MLFHFPFDPVFMFKDNVFNLQVDILISLLFIYLLGLIIFNDEFLQLLEIRLLCVNLLLEDLDLLLLF